MPKTIKPVLTAADKLALRDAANQHNLFLDRAWRSYLACNGNTSAAWASPERAVILAAKKRAEKVATLTYTAALPDGTLAKRTSFNPYANAVVYSDGHATFHHDAKLAAAALHERLARYTKAASDPNYAHLAGLTGQVVATGVA